MERIDEKTVNSFMKSKDFPRVDEGMATATKSMIVNTDVEVQKLLSENTLSSDIASFTPILVPVVRRAMPSLIATELVGVQPLKMPTGLLYAMTTQYQGSNAGVGTQVIRGNGTSSGAVLMVIKKTNTGTGKEFENAATTPVDIKFENKNTFAGKVVYGETYTQGGDTFQNIIVNVSDGLDSDFPAIGTKCDDAAAYATEIGVLTAYYKNEALWLKVLKNYTGPYTTAQGEALGNDMRQLGFSISSISVSAVTRKLKGLYTMEMVQDLKAQHGLDAEKELIAMMSAEVGLEIDRSIIAKVNEVSTITSDFSVNTAAGRWEIEKYRVLATRISNEAREIGRQTRRASANKMVVSPKVATLLEQIGGFVISPVPSVKAGDSGIKPNVGKFDNRYDVIVDNFADYEYVTLAYKGSNLDAGVFFAPYQTSMTQVVDPVTGQPGVILMNRYGLVSGPLHPETFFRTFGVDLSGTTLA